MTKEKSKRLIRQDDSLSIHRALYKAPLWAAAWRRTLPPKSSYNLHIDTYNGTTLIWSDCGKMTSQQTLKFE